MDQQLAALVGRHLAAENGQDLPGTLATRAPQRTIANGGPPSTSR
jgi:hypothetical protein